MKKISSLSIITFFLIFLFHSATASSDPQQVSGGWKAGVARVVITPEQPMWMAGYGSRKHEADGTLAELWAKALFLEDADGKQAVLITTDVLGFPKNMSDHIRDGIKSKFGLSKDQVILSSSHTHSGPVLRNSLYNFYPLDARQLSKIENYSSWLEDQVVNLVGSAKKSMVPVEIFAQNGVTRFAVNRRNNTEAKLLMQNEYKGPNDHAVPVMKVLSQNGDLLAVVFGYACHNTVLDIYKWSGDYSGFAQAELEKTFPGLTALYFSGAAADQNPLPRRTIPLAQQYGEQLAAAVKRVLKEDMRKLTATLSTQYSEIDLPFADPPTIEELTKISAGSSESQKKWAANLLERAAMDKSILKSYPYYPCQVWKIGDQPIMILGGELVVEYAIELKKIFGLNTYIIGYSNDLMSYIPSVTIIREGGYEGDSSQRGYGLAGVWSENIETLILREMERLGTEAGLTKSGVK